MLLVEDSEDDAALVRRALARAGYELETARVDTRPALEAALNRRWDVALVDYGMPAFSGIDALRLIADRAPNTPAIMLSGSIDGEMAVASMQAGARDFLRKENLDRLPHAVERELESARQKIALARSEEQYRAIFENSLDLVSILDAEGNFLVLSPSTERALGYTRDELVGANSFDFIHPDDVDRVRREFVRGIVDRDSVARAEYRWRHKDGSWLILESVGRNLLHDAVVEGVLVSSRDLTEARGLEEQLRRRERLEAIGQLAGGIAHDFNNVLLVIRGYSASLAAKLEDDDLKEKADAIVAAAEQAAALTRQLLAFGRRQSLRPVARDVADAVRETETLLRRLLPEDVELIVLPPEDPATVWVDGGGFEQVLVNLATNARDAMPGGGAITVSWDEVELLEGAEEADPPLEPGRYVALHVSDTGTGIEKDVLSHVFEPFYTTKPQGAGTGLGLPTVHGIAAQSGGGVAVETTPGSGTAFTVYLPAAEDVTGSGPAVPVAAAGGGHERLLLVEDNPEVRAFLDELLREHGYDVRSLALPDEALQLPRDDLGSIDLLISDVVLPGMSGYDLADALRECCVPDIRLLFISGYAEGLRAAAATPEPDAPLLQKPFTPDELLRTVRAVIDR